VATTQPRQRSATELLPLIDWDALPAGVRETIAMLGPALDDGLEGIAELQRATGLKYEALRARLDAVRAAIVEQARARADELDPRLRELLG
jgi:hypothetical protein